MEILYRDEQFVAVNKPAGLLVHRSMIDRSETRFLLQIVRDLVGQRVFPIHRLDKPTAGVVLLALNAEAARHMTNAFAQGLVRKAYTAVVRGYTLERDLIDYPLVEQADKMTDARARKDKPAQAAVTGYERLATAELPHPVGRYATARYSLLRLVPETGRKHQIRRHMKHIFHPIIGDTTHGDGRHNRFFRSELSCERLLLAATELAFTQPYTGAEVRVRAPLDDEFGRVLTQLGWARPGETLSGL